MMAEDLLSVVAEMRADAVVLRKHGGDRAAATLDDFAARLEASDELGLLAWVNEADATRASGHTPRWFRERRAAWAAEGLARQAVRGWQYRRCIVPGLWARQAAA